MRLRILTWNTLYPAVRTALGDWTSRGPVVFATVRDAAPDVVAFQEFVESQLGVAPEGYVLLPGEPTGISPWPRRIVICAPVALLLWGLAWWRLGPPPWSFLLTLLHAVLFTVGVLAPLALFAIVRYRGPFPEPGEFLPILYRPDRLRLIADGTCWFSNAPTRRGTSFPLQLEPRVVHWARFAFRDGDETFLLVNAHLSHMPWLYASSARLLLDLIARERPGPDAPVVLVGDFNALPEAGVMRRLRTSLTDAFTSAPTREGPAATFQWNLAPGMAPLKLDHVLFSGTLRATSIRVLTPRPDGKTASDHDPVVVEFE